MKQFKTFSLLPKIQESLDALGFTTPTEIQAKIIPMLIEDYRQDVHAQAQTGTGKTLAFGIPLLQAVDPLVKRVQGLIMAPTRELVLQIYESLKDVSRGSALIIEPIYGGMPINRQIENLKKGVQVIIGTPGRINDHLRRGSLRLDDLKILVLDEADIMLDMGFRQELDEVLSYAPKMRTIWLFSATVMGGIKQLVKSHMHNVISIRSSQIGVSSSQVKQYYCVVPTKKRVEATIRFIEAYPHFNGIIFCRTKTLVNEVTEELASTGLTVNCLHGDMKQSLRNHVIQGFKKKDFTILVATDVAARGIDVSGLTHVINYSVPDEVESYIHRIGRTGRAGKEGIAIVFVSPSELYKIRRLEKVTNAKILEIAVPPFDAIINVKMGAVSDFIEQAKKDDRKHTAVEEAITKIVDSFSKEEIYNALKVALRQKFFSGLDERKKGFVDQPIGRPQEICIELGQEKGINEDQVRSYLYTTCKLLPQEVSKVRVLRNKTFISIPPNRLQGCFDQMKQTPLIDKRVKIYLVDDMYRPGRQTQGKRKSKFKGMRKTRYLKKN